MTHAQKPDFVFRRNGGVHLNRQGRQFSRLLAAEVCAPAVVMLDTLCSDVVWRILAIHSIRQFPLHFPSRASPYAITFQLDSNNVMLLPPPLPKLKCHYFFLAFPFSCSVFKSGCPGSFQGHSTWDLWWTKWPWHRFSPSTLVFPCQYHSANGPYSSHLHVTLSRRPKGRSHGTFQTAVFFRKSISIGYKSTFTLSWS